MKNKIDLLKIYIQNLQFDIFTFSESWLNTNIPNYLIETTNYNILRQDRTWNNNGSTTPKRGGGIGGYIKNDFVTLTTHLSKYNRNNNNIESFWFEIIMPNSKNVIVCVLYRPPDGNISEFCEILTADTNAISITGNKDIFILGDYNINYNQKKTPDMKSLIEFEQLTNLHQLISEPTRNNNTINLIYTNCVDVSNSGVYDILISDHQLIFCTRKKSKTCYNHINYSGRSYRQYNKEVFQNLLMNENWEEYWQYDNPEVCWNYILEKINNILNIMCPIKNRKIKDCNEPWITDELIDLIHQKNRAWKKAKKSKHVDDIEDARVLRNRVKSQIKRAKSTYVQDYLDDDLISIKKFWEKITYIMPNKSKNATISLIDQDTKIPIEKDDIPNFINNFFISIGQNMGTDINPTDPDGENNYNTNPLGAQMPEMTVNEDMLLKIIMNINTSKASSIENINSVVLKDAFLILLPQLVKLYQLSLTVCVFPDSWKIANVIPLQKPGDPTNVNNLRPISLLPLPGKVLERIVHTQLIEYLETNKLIDVSQGGFRKGKSTMETVANFTDDVLSGINNNEYALSIFVDLRKAFDSVNHTILLNKLQNYGLTINTVNWIQNYLTNRQQQIMVNGITSLCKNITCGVPQGSIMGPLLFLLFINDMKPIFEHCNYKLYADDTVFYTTNKDELPAHEHIQSDLYKFDEWCTRNKLCINIKKTKAMLFGTRNTLKQARHYNIDLSNESLHYVKDFNYLGIKLDCNLDYELHATECYRMVAYKLYLLTHIRKYINIEQAICIYRSKILPYFDYGDIFYNNTFQRILYKLQILQNRALRICLNKDSRYHVNLLHSESNIPLLTNRRNTHILNFIYPRSKIAIYLKPEVRPLRLYTAPVMTEIPSNNMPFERSLLYQGARRWNLLPIDERNIPNHISFKKKQKLKLLQTI